MKEYELQEDENPADFECECGGTLVYLNKDFDTNSGVKKELINPLLLWWEKRNKTSKIATIGSTSFICLLIVCGMFYSFPQSQSGYISISDDDFDYNLTYGVSDTKIWHITYSAYLIPSKDFEYLNMVIKWYDLSGNVIKSDSVWTMNSAKSDIAYEINTTQQFEVSTPKKAEIMVFDSPNTSDNSKAIYKKTITFKE